MAADPLQLDRDEVRFERLYREYAGDVYRYALAIMRNPADAEDVTQATFLNAWRAFSAGEEPRAPLNWFITIAHNVCRLRFRTNSRRPKEVEFEPALAEAPADDGPSASDVLDALAELPLNQRAALVMRELEGRSYGEIATILGVSRSAVETLIFRARRSLRVRREAISALSLLPLPQTLATFLRARGAEAGAASILGSGIAAKAVALVAAGVVATGVARDAARVDAAVSAAAPAAQPAQVASWTASPVSLLVGGRTTPDATPARSVVLRSAPAPATGWAQGGGGRLATIEDADVPPGASPQPAPTPKPSQPAGPAAQPPAAGEPPQRAGPRRILPQTPLRPPSAPVGELAPALPSLPQVPQLPEVPAVPELETPDLPVPDVPDVPDVPVPDVPSLLPELPTPPVEVPELPQLPKLP